MGIEGLFVLLDNNVVYFMAVGVLEFEGGGAVVEEF